MPFYLISGSQVLFVGLCSVGKVTHFTPRDIDMEIAQALPLQRKERLIVSDNIVHRVTRSLLSRTS